MNGFNVLRIANEVFNVVVNKLNFFAKCTCNAVKLSI